MNYPLAYGRNSCQGLAAQSFPEMRLETVFGLCLHMIVEKVSTLSGGQCTVILCPPCAQTWSSAAQ